MSDTTKSNKITRSIGVPTGFTGLRAGGGYSGATDELDTTVMHGAETLTRAYPRFNVIIRFNSDRQSGGAWLATGGNDNGIGICAGYYPDSKVINALYADESLSLKDVRAKCAAIPRTLHVFAHIGTDYLRAGFTGASDDGRGNTYCHTCMPTIEDALAFLQANAKQPVKA